MDSRENAEVVLAALRARRSMARVTADRPPRALVRQILEAAAWAPNHRKTEPWRFIVMVGRAREELGAVMAASLQARLDATEGDQPGAESVTALLDRERSKPLRAPVVIAVAAVPSDRPKVVEIEEVAAVAAAVQNMLLAAEALGLGAMWRTGQPAYDPAVKRFLGLPDHAYLLAFVYLGYPDLPDSRAYAREAGQYTTWLGWEAESAGA